MERPPRRKASGCRPAPPHKGAPHGGGRGVVATSPLPGWGTVLDGCERTRRDEGAGPLVGLLAATSAGLTARLCSTARRCSPKGGCVEQPGEGPSPASELACRTGLPCWDALSSLRAGTRPLCTSPASEGRGDPNVPRLFVRQRVTWRRDVPLRVSVCRLVVAKSERGDRPRFGREPKPTAESGCCRSCSPTKPAGRPPNFSVQPRPVKLTHDG